MTSGRQLALSFAHTPSLVGDDFLVAPCNAEAAAWVDRWPDWPAPALVIHGPPGCGKTHLMQVFLARSQGRAVAIADLAAADPVGLAGSAPALALGDLGAAMSEPEEEGLFHLLNAAKAAGTLLLATSRQPVARWPLRLPDLRSRLLAAASVAIGAPDDELIGAVLVKQFRDRQIAIDDMVVAYLVPRIERSFEAVQSFVGRADRAALEKGSAVTVPLVRTLIDDGGPAE